MVSIRLKAPNGRHNQKNEHERKRIMEKQTFTIPNISCGHCTRTIENELKELEGVIGVSSSIEQKTVTVQWQAPMTLEKLKSTLKEINYPAA
jgi:copper chaperone CopZ